MSPVPIERPSAARRARQTLTRLALLLSAGGCLDDAPVAAGDPTVRATLSANVVGAAAGGIVRIRVGYRTSRQGFVALPSSPQQVAVPAASTVVLPLTVDISPCLADAERATSETAGCALVIELTLTDAAGETLDSQVRDARDPVLPGQSVNFGSVTVGVTVSGVIVTPSSVSMIVSQQQSLSATVRDASGAAVTTVPVVWNSSDATVAQLVPATSTTITIRALKLGTATVTASAGGKTSNSTAVNVVPPTPLTVRQRQGAGCVIVGQTITMEVDSPPGAVTWTSGNPSIASVGATTGIATGVAAGEVAVTASSGGRTGVATLCVTGPLTVLPASLSLTAARTGQIVASGVTGGVLSYASSATGVATVDAAGLVRGVSVGQATITTTFTAPSGTQSRTTAVTVTAAGVVVSPTSGSAALTRTARFTATVQDANGAALPGVPVTWSIADATVGALSATTATAVDVRALKVGATTVRATVGAATASAQFNAVAPLPASRLEKVSGDGSTCPTRSTSCTFVVRAVDANGLAVSGASIVWSSNTACGPARPSTSDDNGLATATNICSETGAGSYVQTATLQTNQQQAVFTFFLRGLVVSRTRTDSGGAVIVSVTSSSGTAAGLTAAIEYRSGPTSGYVASVVFDRTTTPAGATIGIRASDLPQGTYTFDVIVSTTTPGIGPGVERITFFVQGAFFTQPNVRRPSATAPPLGHTP